MSVSFGDVAGTIPISAAARAAAEAVDIPWWQPSLRSEGEGDTRLSPGFLAPALWWAEHVAGIFPLVPANSGGEHAGKVPLLPGPAADPSRRLTDPDEIATVWNARPWANIGLTTIANGILVLDIDPRDGGNHSILDWCAEIGVDLADVPRQASPRGDGGCHLMWKLPPDAPTVKTGSPLDGVDIPWQVPVAPSLRHVEVGTDHRGAPLLEYRPYRWTAGDPRELPDAPEKLITGLSELGRVKGVKASRTGKASRFLVSTDIEELKKHGIAHGQQNNTVQALATSMARRGVPFADAVDTIMEILERSPQDKRRRWERVDLDGGRGIVTRAYEFIAWDRAKESEADPERKKWAESLFASMIPSKG